jgi:hypothetical protein
VRYIDPDGNFTKKVEKALNDGRLGNAYISKMNDCDMWLEKVMKVAMPRFDLPGLWGKAKDTTAEGHRQKLAGKLQDRPELGTNIAFQIDKDGRAIHAFLVGVNPDGSIDMAQCSSNPEILTEIDQILFDYYKKTYGFKGFSQKVKYKNYTEFSKGWGTLKFLPLHDSSLSDKIKAAIKQWLGD